MHAALFCLCLCLLGTVLPTPVPPPARARGNCPGQHQILLKGCNTKHGFYVFKYMYSSFTRRNQTQVKKEEGDHQGTIHGLWLGKVEEAPEQGIGSSPVPEDKESPKPHSHITPASKGEGRALRPSIGNSNGVYPTSTSVEGSGDMGSMLLEIIDGEDSLPQSTRPGGPHGDGNGGNSVALGVLVDGAVTAGRERATDSEGVGGEDGSHATEHDQGIAGTMGTGDSAITSVTKKEDVHVDTKGIGEFAYIPDVDAVTITQGQDGETHISPEDEVKIFIGRANIQVGENDGSVGSTGATSEANVIPTVVTASPQGHPEESATMDTVHHGDSAASRPGGHPSVGNNGDGATAIHSRQELGAPSPRESNGDDATVTMAGGRRGKGRSGQRPVGEHSLPATMTTRGARGTASSGLTSGDCSTAASTPSGKENQVATAGQGESGEVGTAGPERQRARAQQEVAPAHGVVGGMVVPDGHGIRTQPEMASAPGAVETAAPERHRNRAQQEVAPVPSMVGKTVIPERHRARMRPESARLGQAARPEVAPAPNTVGGIVAPEGHWARVWPGAAQAPGVLGVVRPAPSGAYNGDKRNAMGKSTDVPRDPWVWGSAHPQAQNTRGSKVAGGFARLHGGQRMGGLTELEHSRQVEQVRHADRLRLHERALYGLSGVGGPLQPPAAHADPWSADSSQSSEGQWDSHSNSAEEDGKVRGYPYGGRSF
ncbi:matrix extracellular phosphoglycoprotein [Phasianus colchicus]|uniref:matrix extracellular phosphoglycoprotein n=1 Tax=Phasianus colchicus TaxID=9054 RepID=UPI00129D5D90|nr:matrix extracellular phosphoglycoprotein [Phasianus colchicus]